jgi:hypothetical protein
MTISSRRYQEIKQAALAKRAARGAGQPQATTVVETVQKPVACFETAEAIIEYAMKTHGGAQTAK